MHIIIIGNGIAGITAARHIRKKSQHDITVISAETDYFYARTALMYIYMGHLLYEDTKPYEDWFWEKNRINLVRDYVEHVNTEQKQLQLQQKGRMDYDKLILATGSKSNFLDWPGINLKGVQGLYNIQDLEKMEAYTKYAERGVIVGGGLIGIEMAEMLHTRGIPVTMLVRENSFWDHMLPPEESEMVNREIREHHIDLRLQTELAEIKGDEQERVAGTVTKDGQEINCQFLGITIGVHPNLDCLQNTNLQLGKGIQVNNYLETNVPDVLAGGDCAELIEPKPGRRPIEPIWYTGKIMGEVLAHNAISDQKMEYDPGIWYNSAKFFTIEYQVYGSIKPQLPENEETIYWEHPNGKKSIRINYERNSRAVLGFNLMGVRYRHRVCEDWIQKETSIEEVLADLPKANFDPELNPQYEQFVVDEFNRKNPDNPVTIKRKKGLFGKMKEVLST